MTLQTIVPWRMHNKLLGAHSRATARRVVVQCTRHCALTLKLHAATHTGDSHQHPGKPLPLDRE